MSPHALYLALCCCAALIISGSHATSPTVKPERAPKVAQHMVALAGGCKEAAGCIGDVGPQFISFVRHIGRSEDPVEEFCGVAAARAECLEQCPNEPPEHSLVHIGNAIDALVCHEKKQEFKDAVACFKSVPWDGPEGTVMSTNAACTPCRQLSRDTVAQLRAAKVNEGDRTLAHYVGMLNGDAGLVGQACSTVRCGLGCLESVSEEHCGDKRHGELVRELVRLAQSELGDVVQHLGLGCLVPDACKPSAN